MQSVSALTGLNTWWLLLGKAGVELSSWCEVVAMYTSSCYQVKDSL